MRGETYKMARMVIRAVDPEGISDGSRGSRSAPTVRTKTVPDREAVADNPSTAVKRYIGGTYLRKAATPQQAIDGLLIYFPAATDGRGAHGSESRVDL